MKSQVIAGRCWGYPYQSWAGAEKLLPFMTALIDILNRSSSSILLIFAEKLLNCLLKIMGFVQLQTGEAFLKTHQHFSDKNKLSSVLQNWTERLKEAVSLFLLHLHYLANLSFLSYFPSLTSLHREQKELLECFILFWLAESDHEFLMSFKVSWRQWESFHWLQGAPDQALNSYG